MARKLLVGVVLVVGLAIVGTAAGNLVPILRSAKIVDHHLVLEISVSNFRPIELQAARRRVVDVNGALLKQNVRLRETIKLPASQGAVASWQSPKALRRGTWFVQVIAVQTGGVTDCPPKMPRCGLDYSNVRRVVVPKSS